MYKDDTASGLLSKLVKFVRNPTTNWAELDSIGADKDDAVNKQLLKEMIERKRRNDFVRKREFDMLRKLPKLEALAETDPDPAGRPSFFQSSMTSRPDDRASTLKKIDEIEEQMSMQWWKTKNHTPASSRFRPSLQDAMDEVAREFGTDSLLPAAYRPTRSAGLESLDPAHAENREPMLSDLLPSLPPRSVNPVAPVSDGVRNSRAMALAPSLSARHLSAELPDDVIVHDAELEESAILFANGDDGGAETGLLDLLAPGALRADHVDTWLTLFDLYRATGEQVKFEASAIEFAERFHRSAPQWFSLPDQVRSLAQPREKATQGTAADWVCPSVLGVQSVRALNASIARAVMPWRLDWSHLKTLETSALEPLYKVFSGWANQPVQLRFMGEAQLQKVLLNATSSSVRGADQKWWLLRMELLRIIHQPDDFELAALDFCVTYELSPPAWEIARSNYKSLDKNGDVMGGETIIGTPTSEFSSLRQLEMAADSSQALLTSSQPIHFLSVELSGQIQGHTAAVLERLETSLTGADRMQICCAKLIRVDFAAAGMLLNWVSARQAENRLVEFSEVSRLVAAFFNVIGITEYAKVVIRTD
ncbi:MAG: STAS domain-containing protein [Polaromonas sp.]